MEEEMRHETSTTKGKIRRHLTYANVMVTLLAFVVLAGGSAIAAGALGKNSVGSRQLKAKAVTTGKIANNAVNGSKVANGSLTGSDIKLSALGTVPAAAVAESAATAGNVGGHAASCPAATILIRGLCFDASSNPVAPTLEAAAEACAAKGGSLPTPMQLFAARNQISLGTGVGPAQHQFTDSLYSKVGEGKYTTIVLDGAGSPEEHEANQPSAYFCVYSLLR
jgi:hypothetical protein